MYRGLGIIVDPGMCNTFGIFCGDGSASSLPGIPNAPAPTAPAVPVGYQGGLLTGDPQALINSTIDPSAAQDRLNIANWFAQVNAANQAGNPPPLTGNTLALLVIGGIALLALLKR
jgi:hypothetical protein